MTSRLNLTPEDRKILLHVEEFGSITISQCQNMFYKTQAKGYEISRRHLSKLCSYSKLNVFKEPYCNKNVYHDGKRPSYHKILLMDYYSMLIKNGAFIIQFFPEKDWMGEKYFSDAYCVYSINKIYYFDIIEIVRTKSIDKKKYIDIYESKEAHEYGDDILMQLSRPKQNAFPRVIIIDDVVHREQLFVHDSVKVLQLDFKLNNFISLLQ